MIHGQREKDLERAKKLRFGHLKIANKNKHANRLRRLLQDSIEAIDSKTTTILLKPVEGTFGGTLPLFVDEKKIMQALPIELPCNVLRLNPETNGFDVVFCYGIVSNENGLQFGFADGIYSDTIASIKHQQDQFILINPCIAFVRGADVE